jgi:hypothetical protein
VEEFLLDPLLAGEKLHIVEQQHIDVAVALAELGHQGCFSCKPG